MFERISKIVVPSLAALAVCACVASSNALTTALHSASSAAGNAAEQSAMASLSKSVPGISQAQSALGTGSLLGLAKGKMTAAQFSQIEKAIPGADKLMQGATKKGLPQPIKSYADVDSFLVKSGMSSTQVGQLATSLEKTVSGLVPANVSTAFSAALNPGTSAQAGVATERGTGEVQATESTPTPTTDGAAKPRATNTGVKR